MAYSIGQTGYTTVCGGVVEHNENVTDERGK